MLHKRSSYDSSRNVGDGYSEHNAVARPLGTGVTTRGVVCHTHSTVGMTHFRRDRADLASLGFERAGVSRHFLSIFVYVQEHRASAAGRGKTVLLIDGATIAVLEGAASISNASCANLAAWILFLCVQGGQSPWSLQNSGSF